jgi:O-antigen/teichoic acid export membrane protein
LSIKRNSIANYIGQGYTILIGISITPLYLQYLSAEAYGLVGFFALMQAWLNLLDLGLSPTLGRQVAYARGQKNGFEFFKRLLKSFELIFIVLALIIITGIYLASDWVAQVWIKADILDLSTLIYCIGLMGVMIGLRWFSALYRSGINGMEDQVWLSAANIVLISLKFIGSLILLAFITQDIRHFFEYQLVIGALEVLLFMWHFYRQLPATEKTPGLVAFDWQAIKSVAPFALGIAYTAGIWILITQTDKLILSGILSLAEFGYFSLVALMAGGIMALSGPISQAIMPRMTLLISQGKQGEMLSIYKQASQIVTVISRNFSITPCSYAFSRQTFPLSKSGR